ncbi:MAG: isoprenylcysteine carboxylmethyltransferase family protein [Gemmatimonadales bacterium]
MSARADVSASRSQPPPLTPRRLIGGLVLLGATAAGFLALAGRLDWVEGWVFVLGFATFANGLGLWLRKADPDLLRERQRRAANVEPWDRRVVRIHGALFVATLIVAALDAGRFRWSRVPLPTELLAWAGLVAVFVVIVHVFRVNSFLSGHARIQHDRGHTVVTTGLYSVVRHPMYLAIVGLAFLLPLALGSLWALLPGALMAGLFVYRTAREDRMLLGGLPGYPEYAARVRYRLLPGVW